MADKLFISSAFLAILGDETSGHGEANYDRVENAPVGTSETRAARCTWFY